MSATGWQRGAIAAASLALCLGGLASVTQGVAVPVRARLAQDGLEHEFARRLENHRVTLAAEPRGRRLARPASGSAAATLALPSSGPIARITVARLGVAEIVLAGAATHEQLARGPAVIKQGDAANPVTVLAAHRDTHFLFVRDLREGDEITLQYVTGSKERYRVVRFETLRWDTFFYPLDPARPLLALATCYPFGGTEYGGPWRRVAWAERVA
ncbi:class D sortase [Novosphingobium sp. JCM 18896]|uniref:class D sortase n=1 Tax=Novosphingobium sp. JCM 18896 TaxID=2989731 RepID=UPI0022227AC7|nr:class D sortase [Novosphingobium sp. JCM 18896]MCW1430749.1 class D sortase [Novosphingobium sp. JCM 18896]